MQYVVRLNSFLRPYRTRAILALILLATLVSLDLAIPRLIQRIIDQGIHRHDQVMVIKTGLLMLCISLVSMGIAIGNNILSVRVGEGVARDLREALFLKIQSFSFSNLDGMKAGQLMVRLTSDTSAVQRFVQMSLRIGTRAPLLMMGSLVLMVNTSPSLALTMVPLLVVTLVIIVFFMFRMEPLFRLVQQKFDRLNTVLQENIAGVRLVKAFVRAGYENVRFEAANEEFTVHSTKVAQFLSTMSPALTICVNVGMVIVIWVGGIDSIRGELTVGQIVAFTNYLLTTMTPLLMMSRLANVWANGTASALRIYEILDTEPEVRDGLGALAVDGPGRLVFENVFFQYDTHREEPVLDGINLVVEPGEMLAILGATGSGKSTLVNLVPRFYDVTAGRILLDGVEIRQVRQDALLGLVGVVPQETILFSGSVRDNIRYGAPESADEEVIAAAIHANSYALLLMPLTGVLGNFFVIVLASLGGWLALRGLVSVGIIATFIIYGQNFVGPLRQLANMYNAVQAALAGAERIFEIIDTPAEIDGIRTGRFEQLFCGRVRFEHVGFSYQHGVPIITDMNFEAKAGETIALVGPTGAGKTTIINLLTRFYEISSGRITIDGADIRDISKANLRRRLGLVLQDTFLFSDTVLENIRFGRLEATDEECIQAARLAEADHFILRLPHGYQTNLSERAGNLSQGQRQLLAIARAILADPGILILDEATSNVDSRTEIRIQTALLRLMKRRTSFVIAHRLSTIRDANQVLVINNGKIVEQGTHHDLLDRRGFYHHLYLCQFKGQEI